jgi:hypothetical protein
VVGMEWRSSVEDGKECVQLSVEAISRAIAKESVCERECVRECAVKDRERGATRQTVIPNGGRRRSDGRKLLRGQASLAS